MTRSIFDPTGGETERSGSTHLGPDARNISHMPPGVTDGEAQEGLEADAADAAAGRADEAPQTPPTDSAEVARRLGRMTQAPGAETSPEVMPPPTGA